MNGFTSAEATILQTLIEQQQQQFFLVQKQLSEVERRLSSLRHLPEIKEDVAELREAIDAMTVQKDWYTTSEVAHMAGISVHTVRVRWCAEGRIACSKDPTTGHWRIPGEEYERLRRGGKPHAAG